jgi:hypothetical protein
MVSKGVSDDALGFSLVLEPNALLKVDSHFFGSCW